MMDDPVAEIGGEYLSFHRSVNDEADARSRLIRLAENLFIQVENVGLKVFLKGQGVNCVSLVLAGIKIRLKQIGQYLIFVQIVE